MLYIHTPLCTSKCYYCDFYSISNRGVDTNNVVGAMSQEILSRASELTEPLSTIYFGGGTPSLLTLEQVESLLDSAAQAFDTSRVEEISFEANPDGLTLEYLVGLRKFGINRLSIGIQSFSDERLRYIGRKHSSSEAIRAVELARQAGFENISIDLMFGFEHHSIVEWARDIDTALSLGVEHISAYQLSIESGTLFGRRGVKCASDEECELLYKTLHQKLEEAGYEHYEISNYAKPGYYSRHNSGYWTGRAYVGIGPGAHSYNGTNCRQWNLSNLRNYVAGMPLKIKDLSEQEYLSSQDLYNEYLMTRLRTAKGIDLNEFESCFRVRFQDRYNNRQGLKINNMRAYIEPIDFFTSDYIISSLFEVDL